MTIREALLSMGYKEIQPGQWMKPVGYQALYYHEGKNEWRNFFAYESKKLNDDVSYVKQLKEWECFTRTDMWVNGNSGLIYDQLQPYKVSKWEWIALVVLVGQMFTYLLLLKS